MTDERKHQDKALPHTPASSGLARYLGTYDPDIDGAEASCSAFGYLRGNREAGSQLELRFRDGNSRWFCYG